MVDFLAIAAATIAAAAFFCPRIVIAAAEAAAAAMSVGDSRLESGVLSLIHELFPFQV